MKNKTISFLLIAFSIAILPLMSQRKIDNAFYRDLYQKAESLFNGPATDSTDSLALRYYTNAAAGLQNEAGNANILYNCYERSGLLKQGLGYALDSVLQDYYAALLVQKKNHLPDSILFRLLLSAGNVHYAKALFDSSVYYFSRAETIIDAHPSAGLAGDLYNSLGALYSEAGNYEQSGIYFSKALELTKQNHPELKEAIFAMSANIASAVRLSGYQDSALFLYKKLLDPAKPYPAIINNISAIYIAEKKPDSALFYLQLSRTENGNYSISNLNALAQAYMLKGNAGAALQQLQQASSFYREDDEIKNNSYGATQKYWGDLLMTQQHAAQALPHYQKALIQLDDKFNDTNTFHNPGNFVGDFASYNLFDALSAKAACLAQIYTDGNNKIYLDAAISTYDSAFVLADYIRKSIDNDQARLFISDKVFVAYKKAVDFIIQINKNDSEEYLVHALQWISKSRSASLAISLKENTIQRYAGIPDSLLQKEKNLKIGISRMKLQLRLAADSAEQKQIESGINSASLALQSLYNSFRNYPAYYHQKFSSDSISIPSIQKNILDDKTAVICYFKGIKQLYTFVISRHEIDKYQTDSNSFFDSGVDGFTRQLTHYNAGEEYQKNGGLYLYNQLVAPVKQSLSGMHSLIIIPDGNLINLPFEALTTNENKYFVQDFAITYQYALPFLQQNSDGIVKKHSIAFAPFALGNSNADFATLPSSLSEISVFEKSAQVIDSAATKDKFLSNAAGASMIHLATHAVADFEEPEQSYIAFYENKSIDCSYKLFAHELYNLKLPHTQFVFLSACETGSGRISQSEGALSLSRAFAFAGCPNIVTSLWKAEDKSTAYISTHFYKYINEGYTYAHALQQAKIDLLTDETMIQFRSPAYWSHLIFIGNVQPNDNDENHLIIWILLLFVVLLGGLFIYFMKWKSKMRTSSIDLKKS